MRLIAYRGPERSMIGAVEGDMVRPLASVEDFYGDPTGYLGASGGEPISRDSVVECPPVPVSARVACIGLNYSSHIAEMDGERPEHPNIFARWASTLCVNGSKTPVPPGDDGLDWEAELAVVIGSELRDVTESEAMAGVLGYTCFNDISARGLQLASPQWALGKNTDNSGPIGPSIVTADELGDPYGLRIRSRLNGETMQDASTGEMIFKIAETISYISRAMTLHPGDVLATGTPDGVGMGRRPPLLMTAGDAIEVEIEGIGILATTIC